MPSIVRDTYFRPRVNTSTVSNLMQKVIISAACAIQRCSYEDTEILSTFDYLEAVYQSASRLYATSVLPTLILTLLNANARVGTVSTILTGLLG